MMPDDSPDCAECGVGEATKNCTRGCFAERLTCEVCGARPLGIHSEELHVGELIRRGVVGRRYGSGDTTGEQQQ